MNNIFENKIVLAGNPNVGKSTIFNSLTGLKQHTGNWAGKTVDSFKGHFYYKNQKFIIIDTPGTYSLFSKTKDESYSTKSICFNNASLIVIACDATCLERNLNLALQIIETGKPVILCLNLIDEATRKEIYIDVEKISKILNVPIVLTNARKNEGIENLKEEIFKFFNNKNKIKSIENNLITYDFKIENIINDFYLEVEEILNKCNKNLNTRWVCLQLIQNEPKILEDLENYLKCKIKKDLIKRIEERVLSLNLDVIDEITSKISNKSSEISNLAIDYKNKDYNKRDLRIDKIITSKKFGIPIMIFMLSLVFWITIVGSNYPSTILSNLFLKGEEYLKIAFSYLDLPIKIQSFFIDGIYKVLAWVIAVMLPPMAIFFPLFTILEDLGYLARVAFNLDKAFKNCNTCGKQALTMAMGFGCNCVGITGCRIIDSPRERIIAILTNNFVPCNGRFPILIAIISMFLIGKGVNAENSILASILLTFVILSGIFMTFIISKLLSLTILKGLPSNFTLEIPPYRKPQILKTVVNSIFNRTFFVLGRSILVAIPAGAIIWIMANISFGQESLLNHFTLFLDPFGKIMGLDGVILMAFILGFPANEIVIPIMLMAYMNSNTLVEYENIYQLKSLLLENGWTLNTAISTIIFTIFHFPCATACLTVKKETNSFKWTILSFILPTIVGVILCIIVTFIFNIFV